MKQALIYSLKVWLTTAIISPILIIIIRLMIDATLIHSHTSGLLVLYLFMLGTGLMLSLPSAILLWLMAYSIIISKVAVTFQRTLIAIVSFLLVCIPLIIIGFMLDTRDLIYHIGTYYLVTVIAIAFYDWKVSTQK